MTNTRMDDDLATQARQRAHRAGALIRSLSSDWSAAPGAPDIQSRVLDLRHPWSELEASLDEAAVVSDLAGCVPLIKRLADAVRDIYQDDATQELGVLKRVVRDILAACYVLEQFIERAVGSKQINALDMFEDDPQKLSTTAA
ncbi:hypothetical protein G6L37_00825 [Agrobacterium rubi]|nr:hypothetical protein [Agrobacterium rubi]NTF23934.1 hypothetical protein [Agrobacterium rubi]